MYLRKSKLLAFVSCALFGAFTAGIAHAGVSETEKAELLAQHNAWRVKYGMSKLEWSDSVAGVAQKWANGLAASGSFKHSQNNKYGENLWMGTAGAYKMPEVVDGWGNEVNNYDLETNTCESGKVCGHFTQVVWHNTTKIGCGKATGHGNDVVTCNYDPPGNYVGQNPFGEEMPKQDDDK